MTSYLFETERCLLREMHAGDAENIYRLNLHPDIFRFTTDPPFADIEEATVFLSHYDAYAKNGFGRWAVELKNTGEFIGWCGLKYILSENEVDVGYRFLPEYWGMGFAVETGLKCCEAGLYQYGLTRIVARVHKENFRSIRVAEKMKMEYEKDLIYDEVPWLNFVLRKS